MSIEEQLLTQPSFVEIPDIDTLNRLPDGAVILTRTARICAVSPHMLRATHVVECLEFGDDIASVVGAEDLPALLLFNPDWMTDEYDR